MIFETYKVHTISDGTVVRCQNYWHVAISIASGTLILRNIPWTICLSVGRSVRKVYCGKTADWIQMSFRVVSARVTQGIHFACVNCYIFASCSQTKRRPRT